jgi:hypothetical protein
VRQIDARRADGTTAPAIAAALGHRNIRTRTFSARLSSARQFGLITMHHGIYSLTSRGRSLIHPAGGEGHQRLLRESFLSVPLYADLAMSLAGKPLPDPQALAGRLEQGHRISTAASRVAAQVFLASAREASLVDDAGVLRLDLSQTSPDASRSPEVPKVHVNLQLAGTDLGKTVEVKAPASLSRASFDRLIAALEALIHIDNGPSGHH